MSTSNTDSSNTDLSNTDESKSSENEPGDVIDDRAEKYLAAIWTNIQRYVKERPEAAEATLYILAAWLVGGSLHAGERFGLVTRNDRPAMDSEGINALLRKARQHVENDKREEAARLIIKAI